MRGEASFSKGFFASKIFSSKEFPWSQDFSPNISWSGREKNSFSKSLASSLTSRSQTSKVQISKMLIPKSLNHTAIRFLMKSKRFLCLNSSHWPRRSYRLKKCYKDFDTGFFSRGFSKKAIFCAFSSGKISSFSVLFCKKAFQIAFRWKDRKLCIRPNMRYVYGFAIRVAHSLRISTLWPEHDSEDSILAPIFLEAPWI